MCLSPSLGSYFSAIHHSSSGSNLEQFASFRTAFRRSSMNVERFADSFTNNELNTEEGLFFTIWVSILGDGVEEV